MNTDPPILTLEEAFRWHPRVQYSWPEHGPIVGTVSRRQPDGTFRYFPVARKRSVQKRIDRHSQWAARRHEEIHGGNVN